jgi:hypothetical protein
MMKFVVAGVVRDIGNTIEKDISRFRSIFEPLGEIKFVLVESNSVDNSVQKLEEISKSDKNVNFISLGPSKTSLKRTERIAEARNTYLDFIENRSDLKEVDFLVVSDFNNLNNKLTTDAIRHSLELDGWDVCTANQSKRYYDIWALRHPLWSPNDCWQQLEFYRKYNLGPSAALNASVQSRMLRIPRNSDPIEVDSAFGGFAIYKMDIVGDAKYSGLDAYGNQICEHVPFHKSLKEKGFSIIINPNLINAGWVDHTNQTRLIWKLLRFAKYPIKWIHKKFNI